MVLFHLRGELDYFGDYFVFAHAGVQVLLLLLVVLLGGEGVLLFEQLAHLGRFDTDSTHCGEFEGFAFGGLLALEGLLLWFELGGARCGCG